MKRNIAIIGGGDSPEYEISVKSAKQIIDIINKDKYNLFPVTIRGLDWKIEKPDGKHIPVDLRDFSLSGNNGKIRFDYAFNIIHGTQGENALLQSYIEMQKIP